MTRSSATPAREDGRLKREGGMNYACVCSGISAPHVAWKPLGWTAAFFAEIEPFPSAVLAHHYPGVPNHGDMTRFKEWPDASIDVLVGGTPCQSFSVAGLRKGLDDPRGNLALTFLAVVDRYRPEWVVWENVPGVLSSSGGRDFGAFLGGLGELGYGFVWRCLDAQWFGLAQRRKRVFVVGHSGDWRRAAAVLFEPEGLRGDTAPSREAGEETTHDLAPCIGASGRGFERTGDPRGQDAVVSVSPTLRAGGNRTGGDRPPGTDVDTCDSLIPMAFGGNNTSGPLDVATAVNAHGWPHGRLDFESETFIAHSLRADGFDASEDGTGRGTPLVPVVLRGHSDYGPGLPSLRAKGGDAAGGSEALIAFSAKDYGGDAEVDLSPTLRAGGHDKSHANAGVMPAVAYMPARTFGKDGGIDERFAEREVCDALHTSSGGGNKAPCVATGMAVRRLTPVECERLQGFPDNFTLVPYRGKPASDGPRYKVLGNSMAVPVVAWIGRRIALASDARLKRAGSA